MKKILIATALTFAGAAPAPAQEFSPPDMFMDFGFIMQVTGQDVVSQALDEHRASGATKPTPTATLTYTPSKQRRAANLAQFVAKSRTVDPEGAAAMEQMFAQGDIIETIGGYMTPVGLSTTNIADAYAMWWILAWYAQEGRESELDRATAQAVKAQAARAIAATPEVAGAGDAAKQELAEALIIQGALVDGGNDKYRDDPEMARQLAQAVRQGAEAMGLDLASMTLTKQGFVPRQGSDAGGSLPAAAERRALAAGLSIVDHAGAGC